MNHDTSLALLAGVVATAAALLGVDQFPDELPGWLGFLILVVGAGILIGQVIGRTLDEFGPPRPKDRYKRERTWTGLWTTIGGLVGAVAYVVVAVIVLVS